MTSQLTDFTSALARWEAEQPDSVALRFGKTVRTWSELARRVRQNAAAQRAEGLRPGETILVERPSTAAGALLPRRQRRRLTQAAANVQHPPSR